MTSQSFLTAIVGRLDADGLERLLWATQDAASAEFDILWNDGKPIGNKTAFTYHTLRRNALLDAAEYLERNLKSKQGIDASKLVPGTVFSTAYETGCVVLSVPSVGALGDFLGRDSSGVECQFGVQMVTAIERPA